ncbi:substrate-binding periplasmic protein [Glycomyces harbinensis]|uniref:Glutamate transport system substrate-binding protein n=1 Tax=Glycomyces harbinensis TaxID=58114 RepID=A0A1G6R4M2_9ACTN|nr:transporter substrate-binding domain-containing protein [Glycomyces harbinensis]SDC99441.1 glutamate transport system substrate-binding protein [Glycomyces harbinensis]
MNRLRTLAAGAACAAMAAALTSCAADEDESILDKDVLHIGVFRDYPLISEADANGTYDGFDVQVARHIADDLGIEAEFVPLDADDRITFLQTGEVDLVFAAFSITPDRKQQIDFAGPYVLESFNLLVRGADESITALADLEGKTICEATGANVFERIKVEHGVNVEREEVDTYSTCLDGLAAGEFDAVATDEFILAGLLDSRPELGLEILDIRFSSERIGIGMQPGDTAGCEALNRAITEMYNTGTMERYLQEWFGQAGLDVANPPIPQFEGCA